MKLTLLKSLPSEATDHKAEMVGVGGRSNRAGGCNAGNIGNEDFGGSEESGWEAEENSECGGCYCDECLELAIEVEGDEAKYWSSNTKTSCPCYCYPFQRGVTSATCTTDDRPSDVV